MTTRKGANELKAQLLNEKKGNSPFANYFANAPEEESNTETTDSKEQESLNTTTENLEEKAPEENTVAEEDVDDIPNEDSEDESDLNDSSRSSLGALLDYKKKTIDQTHTRQTYLIRNDLIKRMNKMSNKQGKGFKTKVVNHALEMVLDELEALQKEQQRN